MNGNRLLPASSDEPEAHVRRTARVVIYAVAIVTAVLIGLAIAALVT